MAFIIRAISATIGTAVLRHGFDDLHHPFAQVAVTDVVVMTQQIHAFLTAPIGIVQRRAILRHGGGQLVGVGGQGLLSPIVIVKEIGHLHLQQLA